MNVKKGDTLLLIAGDDKGKVGQVIASYPKSGQIRVKGVRILTKHIKPIRDGENGKIRKSEGVIHQSNAMHWSTNEQTRSRVGHKIQGGKKIRYLIKTGEVLP
jgi:large subunit ribosomal protein L24